MAINLNPIDLKFPQSSNDKYRTQRGNPFISSKSDYYWRQVPPPGTTLTKAGATKNISPVNAIMPGGLVNNQTIPTTMLGIRAPEIAANTGEKIENQRVGRQVGAFDPTYDTSYQDWTRGIQYYTIYTGQNMKQLIPPVMPAAPARLDVWGNSLTSFGLVNRQRAQDITQDEMTYSCGRNCTNQIASTTLGTPVPYVSRVTEDYGVYAPLPVQLPGEYPKDVPDYSSYKLGQNTWDTPQPVNAILELQRRKYNLPSVPILPDYPKEILDELKQGININ